MNTAYKAAIKALIEDYEEDFKNGFKGFTDMAKLNVVGTLFGLCNIVGISLTHVRMDTADTTMEDYYQRVIETIKTGGHI